MSVWHCHDCLSLFASMKHVFDHKQRRECPAHAVLLTEAEQKERQAHEKKTKKKTKTKKNRRRKRTKANCGTLVCVVCGKEFVHRSNLRKHMSIVHCGLKPYECNVCRMRFARKHSLQLHTAAVHTAARDKVTYPCVLCGKHLSSKSNQRKHMRNVHQMPHLRGPKAIQKKKKTKK